MFINQSYSYLMWLRGSMARIFAFVDLVAMVDYYADHADHADHADNADHAVTGGTGDF